MTANEILSTGFSLAGRDFETFSDKQIALTWLNVSLAEALPYENQVRGKKKKPLLTYAPRAENLGQNIDFEEHICAVALPYSIAGYLYDDRENSYMSGIFRNRFVRDLSSLAKAVESPITEVV
ncbi:MAG: hypothetical protein RRX95_02630 [Oscillospiraceae bacterium]